MLWAGLGAKSSVSLCSALRRRFNGTLGSKHQLMGHLPPPDLQTTLTDAQLSLRINAGVFSLQTLEQLP